MLGARGEQADVGVEAGGDGVVVAGAEMGVAADDAVGVAADEQRELAVGLEAEDAVVDADAGVLELARPADVGVLVEAGHELDDDGDVLALAGLGEGAEDGGVLAGAVERLLHGDDGGIEGGGLDELFDGGVGVEGVVEHEVLLAQLVEEVGAVGAELVLAGLELGVLEVGTLDLGGEGHEAGEVDGAAGCGRPARGRARSWCGGARRSLRWRSFRSRGGRRRPCGDYVTRRGHFRGRSGTPPPACRGCCCG